MTSRYDVRIHYILLCLLYRRSVVTRRLQNAILHWIAAGRLDVSDFHVAGFTYRIELYYIHNNNNMYTTVLDKHYAQTCSRLQHEYIDKSQSTNVAVTNTCTYTRCYNIIEYTSKTAIDRLKNKKIKKYIIVSSIYVITILKTSV